jgi:hypothetical protein
MRPGGNFRRLGHVGWAQGTPEQIGKSPQEMEMEMEMEMGMGMGVGLMT